jgi:hypothetical protein
VIYAWWQVAVAFDVEVAEAAAGEMRADSGTATHAHSHRQRPPHHHHHPLLSVRYEPAPWQEPWPPPRRQPRPHLDAMSVATEEEEEASKHQPPEASAAVAGATQNLLRRHAGRTWSAGGGNGRWRGGGGGGYHPHVAGTSSSPPRGEVLGRKLGTAPSHPGSGDAEASRARRVSFAPSAKHTGTLFKKGGEAHQVAQPQPFVMCYEQGELSRRR